MKSARIYDFTLQAGGSFTLNVEGDYVRIMSSTGAVEIVTDSMRIGPIMAGQGQADAPYKRITINDKSGAGNVGSVLIASSGFIDNRITGDVSIIDGSKNKTISGVVFGAGMLASGLAANVSSAQIFNPLASGKRVAVSAFTVSPATATASIFAGILNASIGGTDVTATSIRSNYSTAIAPVSQARIGNSAGLLIAVKQFSTVLNVGIPLRHKPESGPFVLEPGNGLVVTSGTAQMDLYVSFEFTEDSI